MAFPPSKKPDPSQKPAAEEPCEDCGKDPCECEEEESASASESSSNAEPDRMKGAKPNPLRKWAAEMSGKKIAGADDEDYEG